MAKLYCSLHGIYVEKCLMFCLAHWGGRRGWRTESGESRVVPGGLPLDAVHRVQRKPRVLPLLCQRVQLLAVDGGHAGAVRAAEFGNAQGGQPAFACQSVPGVHKGSATYCEWATR